MYIEQPQAIRTLFFDVGFTLIHPNPSDLEICLRVCSCLGLEVNQQMLQKRMLEAQAFYLQQIRLNRHVWANETSINELWTTYYMNMLRPFLEEPNEGRLRILAETIGQEYDTHSSWQVYHDVIPTLEALQASKRYTLGAISDWGISLGPILQGLRLNSYFDCLLVSATAGHAKPAPALYESALERANSIADYTLHIGDSYPLDVLGARAVGITPILLDRKRLLLPDQVDCLLIHSLSDLLPLLNIATAANR